MKRDPNWVALIGLGILAYLLINPAPFFLFLGVIGQLVGIVLGIALIALVLKFLQKD